MRFNLSIFAMNVADVWFAYQGITSTAATQSDFYNYLTDDIIDNTYSRFMRRRTIVESDDETADDDNQLFGRINDAPICGIYPHVTSH